MFAPELLAVPRLRRVRAIPAGTLTAATHILDKVLAVLALALASPVFAGMALLSHRRSTGSALLSRRRIGVNGRVFGMLAFRTVRRHAVLDALPQLINVLRGEMSLIGPRPPRPEELCRQLRARPGVITVRRAT